ncbi:helix-turn-helix domain-containing protein [Paenibacillus larvae]|nr:helix-turn-helix domain-containing protein [Paenibacillus larvae]MDT2302993.1 helix-turn-helix domain-containing protein [Paenibacillus larvae]
MIRDGSPSATNGVEIKSTRKVSRMNKGRKTTFEERIEIAQYTIANDLDYQKSMEKYDVSYSQVYAWVRKYKSGGEEASRTIAVVTSLRKSYDHEQLLASDQRIRSTERVFRNGERSGKKVGRDPATT